jgi:hypothetical protein
MNEIEMSAAYYQHLRRIERACQYIWMSARGSDSEPTVYGDAVQHAKEVLASYTLASNPLKETGASMYADELERLTMAGQLLSILVADFQEPFNGYRHISNPETLLEIANELWGVQDDE